MLVISNIHSVSEIVNHPLFQFTSPCEDAPNYFKGTLAVADHAVHVIWQDHGVHDTTVITMRQIVPWWGTFAVRTSKAYYDTGELIGSGVVHTANHTIIPYNHPAIQAGCYPLE